MEVLTGASRYLTVPFAALAVSVLILRGSFARVEHVLLALSAIFVAYVFSGVLAGPDWGATARGLAPAPYPAARVSWATRASNERITTPTPGETRVQ
jgi:Mn2+/Fe2+ NRAMP family transporter